ncbi:hypothetical protein BD289DRAFT_221750 [Coniella lustricola]|uniref:Uncharacterized protein n=1 Tax=Coniella lustricola TaxID=2025994 RepID=A0A2T3AB20_9PEZI|nr:hypothetical protein BD289DRAFT_221750 [Coniella lustricola]
MSMTGEILARRTQGRPRSRLHSRHFDGRILYSIQHIGSHRHCSSCQSPDLFPQPCGSHPCIGLAPALLYNSLSDLQSTQALSRQISWKWTIT